MFYGVIFSYTAYVDEVFACTFFWRDVAIIFWVVDDGDGVMFA